MNRYINLPAPQHPLHWNALAHSSLAWMLGGRLASALLSLALLPVMLQGLGLHAYGAYSVLWAVLEMAYLLFGFGLSTVAQRYWPQWWQRGELSGGRLALVFAVRGLVACAVAVAVWVTWEAFSSVLQVSVVSSLGPWYALWLWVGSMGRQAEELMAAMLMQGILQGLSFIVNAMRLGALMLMNSLDAMTLTHVIQVEVFLGLGLFILAAALLWLRIPERKSQDGVRSLSSQAVGDGMRICMSFWWVQVMGQAFSMNAARLLAGLLGGGTAAGVLGAVLAIFEPLRNAQPMQLLSSWVRPLMMARHQEAQSHQGQAQAIAGTVALASAVLKVSWWLVLPIVLILVGWGPWLVQRWMVAAPVHPWAMSSEHLTRVFACFALGIMAQMLRQALSWVALTLALTKPSLGATAAASVILPFTAFTLWLVGEWGNGTEHPMVIALAIATAWALAEWVWCVWMWQSLKMLPMAELRLTRWMVGISQNEIEALKLVWPQPLQKLSLRGWSAIKRKWRPWYQAWRLVWAHAADARSFWRGSALRHTPSTNDVDVQQARVLKTAHRLDKGLALAQPRAGFGQEAAAELQSQTEHLRTLAASSWVLPHAAATLRRWQLFQQQSGYAATGARVATAPSTPYVQWDKALVQSWAAGGFAQLVKVRRSVRQFSPQTVPREAIERAVAMAGCSPSVCNRSAARVWLVQDRQRKAQLLKHQNGNAGFADQADVLLIISVAPQAFQTVAERYQPWIDGGLFAMTLIYALHYQGLGTCCLNWSVEPDQDRHFKQAAQLPPHERIIMLLAVGQLPARVCVAHSPRRPLTDLLHESEGSLCTST